MINTKMRRWWGGARGFWTAVTAPGKEDRRKVVHSAKVGASLTAASLLYLFEPGMGNNSIWAVLTVVIVLEFTAGTCVTYMRFIPTIKKHYDFGVMIFLLTFVLITVGSYYDQNLFHTSIERLYTIALGCVICIVTSLLILPIWAGEDLHQSIIEDLAKLIQGTCVTYMRFIPTIKKHYDFGVMIFLLTFVLITVGSYYDQNLFHTSIERLYTIALGCVICIVTSLLILPIWAGEDLHQSIIEDLAKLIQACVDDYFQEPNLKDLGKSSEDSSLEDTYEELFHLDVAEESLATFASWEPRHSKYCYPWKQYVHLGVVLRHLAYTAFALHGCIDSHIQAPKSVRALFKEPCEHLAEEIKKVLLELAEAIKTHHQFSTHISDHLHKALEELDTSIKAQPQLFLASNPSQKMEALKEFLQWQTKKNDQPNEEREKIVSRTTSKAVITCLDFSEALPFAAFVSLLIEAVARLDLVIEEVEELGKVAHFKEFHEEEVIKIIIPKDCDDMAKISRKLEHEEGKEIMSRNLQYLLSNLSWCDITQFHLPAFKGVL